MVTHVVSAGCYFPLLPPYSRLCGPLLQNYQVDCEAILARSPEPFIQSVSPWLYPPAARETPLQSSPSGQGLTADSARIEDPLADMSASSMDDIANGSIAGISKAAPPETGLQMHLSLRLLHAVLRCARSCHAVLR